MSYFGFLQCKVTKKTGMMCLRNHKSFVFTRFEGMDTSLYKIKVVILHPEL